MTPRTYRYWTTGELRRAAEWYRAGQTHAEIARRLGRSKPSVTRAMGYYGIVRFRKRYDLADYRRRLRRLHTRGYSDQQIAAKLGVPRQTINRWRAQLGLVANGESRATAQARYKRFCESHDTPSLVELRYAPKRVARLLQT